MIGAHHGGDALGLGEGRIVRELDVKSRRESQSRACRESRSAGPAPGGSRRSGRRHPGRPGPTRWRRAWDRSPSGSRWSGCRGWELVRACPAAAVAVASIWSSSSATAGLVRASISPCQRSMRAATASRRCFERRRRSALLGRLVGPVAAIDAGEDGLEPVVIGLGDRVELVIVAPRAVDGHAHEGRHRARDHVVAVEQPRLQLVDGPFAQLDVADEIPRPGGDEPGRDRASAIAGPEDVAGDLLADEPAERQVGVEGGDDIVAIGPGMVAPLVLVVAVRVAVMHHVEPVPAPSLAVVGTGEQAIDQRFVGVGIGVVDERLDFLGSRRQADQVEREAADQRAAIGLGAGLESAASRASARMNASIGVRAQLDPWHRGNLGATERLEGPPALALEPAVLERQSGRPDGASLDPGPDGGDFLLRERLVLLRHLGRVAGDHVQQQAFVGLSRHDRRPTVAPFERGRGRVQRQVSLVRRFAVTVNAPPFQDRRDLARETAASSRTAAPCSRGRNQPGQQDPCGRSSSSALATLARLRAS